MIPVDTKKNKIKDLMNFLSSPSCLQAVSLSFKESVYKHLIKKSVEKLQKKLEQLIVYIKK